MQVHFNGKNTVVVLQKVGTEPFAERFGPRILCIQNTLLGAGGQVRIIPANNYREIYRLDNSAKSILMTD